MRVLNTTEISLEWSDLNNLTYHVREEFARTIGVHVSQVLQYLAVKTKRYTEEDRADDMPLRILLGLAFEEAAARLYKRMWWQPGEFVLDDGIGVPVYGSPDGIEEIGNEWYVHEFKYTGKSLRLKGGKANQLKDIRTEWMWMQQVQTYVNMMRERGLACNKAFVHVCWKYGVYEWPMTERYFKYEIEFENEELDGNLMLMQKHKDEVAE